MNISFLCKWWWKLENEKCLWQQIIQQKYLSHDLTSIVKGKNDDSPIWKDLLKVRPVYLKGRKIKTGRGDRTLFWLDPWLTQQPLCTLYPVLFDLCDMKKCTVLDFLTINGQLHFSRWLPPLLFEQWLGVVNQAFSHPFENEQDKIIWKWHAKGFTSKSVYDKLTTEDDGYHFRHIWKAKIPYKIKFSVGFLSRELSSPRIT